MAITGMDIFQLLPKTNCRECGLPTCIAFAMSLASGKVDMAACPYITDAAKGKLAQIDAPPMRTVTVGGGETPFKTGGESSLYRHEKSFRHPTGIAVLISDTMDEATVDERLARFRQLRYHRMGMVLRAELVAVQYLSGDAEKFVALIEKIKENSDAHLILMVMDPEVVSLALARCGRRKPLIYAATSENYRQMADLATIYGCPLAVKANGLDALIDISTKVTAAGVEMVVLDPGDRTLKQAFENQVHIRRAAVRKKFAPLGFPTIAFPCEMARDSAMETVIAAMYIAKYAGIVVLSDIRGETLFPLLLQRMEIFSDPEAPYMVPQGVTEIGMPGRKSPVLLASSWALTYYNLALAVEASRTPVFLCFEQVREPDIMCWCHHCLRSTHKGKFDAQATARFIADCRLEERLDHRKLVVCARNATFRSELEKALPGWEIVVGPDKASLLPGFLPEFARSLENETS